MKPIFSFALVCLLAAITGCVGGGTLDASSTQTGPGDTTVLQSYTSIDRTGHAALVLRSGQLTLLLQIGAEDYTATTHWQEQGADHFAIWVEFLSRKGSAIEFAAPFDRHSPATLHIYDQGRFVLMTQDGVQRPVPYYGAFTSYKFVPDPLPAMPRS